MNFVPIYCASKVASDARYAMQPRERVGPTVGRAYAGKHPDGSWRCLYCRKPVAVVTK